MGDAVEEEVVTFPPACERTAKQKRVEELVFPSILNSPKAAAWPSMGWETFLSTEYSCIAPTTRFCCRAEAKHNKTVLFPVGQLFVYIFFFCHMYTEEESNKVQILCE